MSKLNITFCSYPDFSGNAKALYEYMVNRYSDNMNYLWVVYNEKTCELLSDKGIDVVLIGSKKFKTKIKKTNIFFTTTGNLDGDKASAKGSYYVELWHGIGPKPTGFAQDHPSFDDINGYEHISQIVDYFIVPSEFWRIIFSSMFKVELSRVLNLGLPLLNYFTNSNGKDNLSKVLDKKNLDYDKYIMYMPTFKKGFNHDDIVTIHNNIFNFTDDLSIDELDSFLQKNNYLLCVKYHPGDNLNYSFKSTKNIVFIDEDALHENNLSVNELINAFDLLITDFSSIGTEFLYLNKPVLFATGNLDEYLDNRGVYFGNYNLWTPGPICDNYPSLLKEISLLLNDSTYYEEEREKFKKLWFGTVPNDGGCKNICDFFFDEYKISKNVKHYKSETLHLKKVIKENDECIKAQQEDIDYLHKVVKENDECIKAQQEDIDYLHKVVKENDECIKAQQEDIDYLHKVVKENDECIKAQQNTINDLNSELSLIKNSKWWKLRGKLKK